MGGREGLSQREKRERAHGGGVNSRRSDTNVDKHERSRLKMEKSATLSDASRKGAG